MELDAYRADAESFVSELMRAYYRHYAGLDDDYPIEPIYERHAHLFGRAAVQGVRSELDAAAAASEERRRLELLYDFAVDGLLGQSTKELEAELARREASATIELDGERIGFRESAVVQANEPDAERREAIERARLAVTAEQLTPLQVELNERWHDLSRELGYASYRDLCEQCKRLDLTTLAAQTGAFSAATETGYRELLGAQLTRTLGFGFERLRRSDLPRFFRAADQDDRFPAHRLVPSMVDTLQTLGVAGAAGAILDVEKRPNKSPRAFCAPVRVPDEVYLVIAPVGGRDDYSALLHESGHTEHYAHVEPGLAFEFRFLGDNAITESFAFLFQHLLDDPVWLERRLGIDDPDELVDYARAHRLVYLRRYAAKLAYELELHGSSGLPAGIEQRYATLLGEALHVDWPTQTYLADVDPGFYSACYLRAWALETHLRAHLREQFGPAWFEEPEAGRRLMSLWREGQRLRPDELLHEVGGGQLDFGVTATDLGLSA